MIGPRWVGATGRYGPGNPDPIRHVWTSTPASRTGECYRALCGRMIRPRRWHGPDRVGPVAFDPEHPRACRECVAALGES